MKTRNKFKLREGERLIKQGNNQLRIIATGRDTYLWFGGKGCYAYFYGFRNLETLAHSILNALKKK